MSVRVGFVGLGAIGRPIAARLAGSWDLTVWNRTEQKARDFAQQHAAGVAGDLPELFGKSEVIVTCLPTSDEVQSVLEEGTEQLHDGQLVVDATSGDPQKSRELADWLSERGVGFVDAPVSGGTSGAEAGTLTVMLGGDDRWIDLARRILEPAAGRLVHVGPVGAGHAVKAVNNALLAVNIEAAAQGLAGLVKFGVKAPVALEVINASSGRSNVTENLFPERVTSRAWPRTFRAALLGKDVGIALKLLRDLSVPSGTFELARQSMERTRRELGEEADHVEAVKLVEREAEVEIR